MNFNYRRKSYEVGAFKFDSQLSLSLQPKGVKFDESHPKGKWYFEPTDGCLATDCLHIVDGDYIVYGPDNARLVMPESAFKDLYEPLSEVK